MGAICIDFNPNLRIQSWLPNNRWLRPGFAPVYLQSSAE